MIKLFIIHGIIFIIIFSYYDYEVFQKLFNMHIIETIKDSNKLEEYYKICTKGKLKENLKKLKIQKFQLYQLFIIEVNIF